MMDFYTLPYRMFNKFTFPEPYYEFYLTFTAYFIDLWVYDHLGIMIDETLIYSTK